MSGLELSGLGFGFLLTLLALRVPIGVAMALAGMAGYVMVVGASPLLSFLKTQMFYLFLNYDLSVISLFMLMGQFASRAGLSTALFRSANSWIGHRRGGIAMATVGGCAGFGAICGSSLATAATMAQVALPELRRHNYSGALATGSLAAGGTLGILIPPSIVLIVCAIIVEANIETLFQAALIPGLLAAAGYMITIAIYVRLRPDAGPPGERASWDQRWRGLLEIWPVMLIFVLVIGGIYFGWFTPTQAASVGAIGTGIIAVTRGGLRWRGFVDTVLATASATALIFLIIFGASLFNAFLGFTRLSFTLADAINAAGLTPMLVLLVMVLIFLVLGCFMDSLSMILLLIPIFWPVLVQLDFAMDPEEVKIWFSIIALIVVEIGLITPPVGLNVFIINAMARDVPMMDTFRGVVPFLVSDAVRVALLIAVPAITLALPRWLN